ncbi:hypothetical protein CCY99_08130 [Helicobacter sp. 16-1353]|uniref:hypothetical protein n=1 Tax=Helicobacter sp. 16-1353 TaxID=2004996 RepID=UPI000DCEED68|nr:hypothetical protein [Helicobacter sp. 16-1353]RAX51917.1 hypothetical protein CCY99_08130 [Helicobacter sp. 16-1353]
MFKELNTIKLISEFLIEKNAISKNINSIDKIYDFFSYLEQHKNKFYTLYIYNYLYNFISSDEVSKRKTSARVFEDLLAIIFNGVVADTQQRKNLNYQVSDYFTNVKDKIASNRREKADIIFKNSYCFSVKTLIDKNTEINMGSFEKKVLFDSLKVDNYLSERKSIDGAGVGSKPQFLKLLQLVDTLSSYENFREKFNQMVEFIYSDDLLLVIKKDNQMNLYFFNGYEIVDIFKEHSKNKNDLLEIVNRYEGNSIRIDRNALISKCTKKIFLDFSYLKDSVVGLINEFDYKLHQSYINFLTKDKKYKDLILKDLNHIFNEFDKNYESLI